MRKLSGINFNQIEQYLGLVQNLQMFRYYGSMKQVRTLSLLLAAEPLYAIQALSKEESTVNSYTCQITLLHLVTSRARVPMPMLLVDLEDILFLLFAPSPRFIEILHQHHGTFCHIVCHTKR